MEYFDDEEGAELRSAFEAMVLAWPEVTAKTMFGCPSYQADGTLFAVLVTEGVALTQLSAEQRDALGEAFETGPFQAGDRTVTKWAQVTVDDVSELVALQTHVRASYETALGS